MFYKSIYLFAFSVFLMSFQCNDDEMAGEVYLINNTDEKIYFRSNVSNNILKTKDFPFFIPQVFVLANDTAAYHNKAILFKSDPIYYDDNYTYQVFIWKQSTIDQYTWEEIKEQNIYDKKFALTFEELREKGFYITYEDD